MKNVGVGVVLRENFSNSVTDVNVMTNLLSITGAPCFERGA
jgi:hypothetical protein